jgi:hypothetical protein
MRKKIRVLCLDNGQSEPAGITGVKKKVNHGLVGISKNVNA